MDQARSRWRGVGRLSACGAALDFGERGMFGGAYYFESVRYHFIRWDVAVVFEELAGLGTDGLEVGFIPLYVFVLRFDVRVNLWCGHAREEERLGANGEAINISNK